jgi:hypothetical protein
LTPLSAPFIKFFWGTFFILKIYKKLNISNAKTNKKLDQLFN